MEIIPDTEAYRGTAEAAANNFEVLGADVRRPDPEIAVEMLNKGLERWEQKGRQKAPS